MDVAQTASFLQSMTYEAGILDYDEFPLTNDPVWILGNRYNAIRELDELKHDFLSRFWFTYRKGYSPIGGVGPSSDAGWGCMLRCGQMMMAEALVKRHLGREWRWIPGKYDPRSFEILRLFSDKKSSTYSIHQIASMGASEGKAVGEWFGPNTIAQVLKKLAVYDEWSKVVIHVALDNTVIIDDLREMCLYEDPSSQNLPKKTCTCSPAKNAASVNGTTPDVSSKNQQNKHNTPEKSDCDKPTSISDNNIPTPTPRTKSKKSKSSSDKKKKTSKLKMTETPPCQCGANQKSYLWRPMLLIIPLRLGLSDINPVYLSALKKCLRFPQSVGIIGGKPNHAHWFIGYVDDQLLFLDPHTLQNVSDITQPDQTDESYHCVYISRMKALHLDPSIAVGFFCGSEAEFRDLCDNIRESIIRDEKTPMFELHQHRPPHWPPFEAYSPEGATGVDFTVVEGSERCYDTDEEFELL